ncbi:soluble N-ethylmaleimide-sensitive factor attachment protein receptor [Coprinopsis cinerea okayama7|uniref:Soluble N-ethylmaleimide-sensitive factor attachment protein receptor n=1 Tax=Coprinopsis cinerea (strain Okayama-7 / 130 / ATCC MYA-4618 / FGSC 9003) TaxID=240176 RepID=A8NN99_COPC7|nr:soluble N-ethylmaleimide-sensitive factor attachment protein receptor [Coprinopsis cinerea okayama7\|eukprot:XP_001835080.2 soluble N-ethylmaleimide-sensitive factor attachment protein receptor [Coprinopsis cinerea okayama7\
MSLAKLTSISTKTLSLLLERQRLQTLPSFSTPNSPLHDPNSSPSTGSLHLTQIKKNLEQLRNGIAAMQAKEGDSEAVGLLRNQYERMRGMLGSDAAGVPSLSPTPQPSPEPSPSPSNSPSPVPQSVPREPLPSIGLSGGGSGASKQAALFLSSSTSPSSHTRSDSHGVFAPYKDDPSHSTSPPKPSYADEESGDNDHSILLQSQRFLMQEQDQRLDELSHSINRQHHLSVQINDELDVHHGLLEELDTGIDRTAGRLGSARKRLDRVAKGIKENSSAFMIGLLIFVLLILIIVLKT